MVIGLNADPSVALNNQQHEVLHRLEGKTVNIGPPNSDCEVIDVNGTYEQWLTSIDASYFILRPDFYVAATAKSEEDLGTASIRSLRSYI